MRMYAWHPNDQGLSRTLNSLQAAPVASSRAPQHGRGGSDSDSEPEGFFERRVLKPLPASLQVGSRPGGFVSLPTHTLLSDWCCYARLSSPGRAARPSRGSAVRHLH